jgi:hypothetical protein
MRYLLLLLFLPAVVLAHSFTFTWVDPTQRTDGTAFNPSTELQSYRMRCEGAENVERIVDRASTSQVTGNTRRYVWSDAVSVSGMYDCKMTALDTGDRESDWSNIASVPKFAAPSAPTDLESQ